jgi:hypothetical protein
MLRTLIIPSYEMHAEISSKFRIQSYIISNFQDFYNQIGTGKPASSVNIGMRRS